MALCNNDDFLLEIDRKADELKQKILGCKSDVKVSGRTFYLSENGNDENDGLTAKTPWQTLRKVNEAPLEKGDAILLERGSIFRGCLEVSQDNITVSTYGEGDKPKIYGSFRNYAHKSDWLETEYKNIYVSADEFDTDVGLIVFDDEKASFKQLIKNFGFTGDISELDEDLKIYYEESSKKVYLYSEGGNPAERFSDIEICTHVSVVSVKADYTTIDNLCLKYCGGHAIRGANNTGLCVQNCEIGWVGGCKQFELADGRSVRYGNGVEIYINCKDFTVKDCYFYEIYDAAITHQFFIDRHQDIVMENIVYSGNLIEYCNYSVEYALIEQTGGSQIMRNIVVEDNIMRYSGYGFGGQRPDKDGASHIKGWDICNAAENFVIRNNIFDRGKYMVVHSSATDTSYLPIYENNIYVQDEGGQWGRYGTAPTQLEFVENSEKFFVFDKGAKWFVKKS